jgi:hypothetical protein
MDSRQAAATEPRAPSSTVRGDPPTRRRRARLVLLTLSTIAAAILAEGLARVMLAAPPDPYRTPQLQFVPDRQAGFVHRPNQAGFLDDGWATINALGTRGPLPVSPKPARTMRILALGDSMTFGWGVGDEETYCAFLAARLRQLRPHQASEVVNGGVAAYDLTHETGRLRQLAPVLAPDIVLVGLYWNDLLFDGIAPGAAMPAAGEIDATRASGGEVRPFLLSRPPGVLNRISRSSRALFALRRAWQSATTPRGAAAAALRWEVAMLEGESAPAIDSAWQHAESSLRELQSIAGASNATLGLVIMPIRAQVEDAYPRADYQARARRLASTLGLFVVDPLPVLRGRAREGLFLPYDRAAWCSPLMMSPMRPMAKPSPMPGAGASAPKPIQGRPRRSATARPPRTPPIAAPHTAMPPVQICGISSGCAE